MRRRKEGNRTVQSANPDFGCACVEIEGAFFLDFGGGIGGRQNFDTDLGSASQDNGILGNFGPAGSEPGDVDSLDAVSGGHRALRQCLTVGEELTQETDNVTLATGMAESWRRAHEDVTVAIGLDAVGDLRQKGISQDLGPAGEIALGLQV